MSTRAIIIALVVTLLVVSWFLQKYESASRDPVAENLELSNGTFDAPAARALEASRRISSPTPRDLYARARILKYWLAENEPNHSAQHEAAETYIAAARGFAEMNYLDLEDAVMLEQIADLPVRGIADIVEAPVTQARKQHTAKSKAGANSKLGASEIALAEAQHHNSDSQNVHDSAVVGDLAETYARLKIPASEVPGHLHDLEVYALKNNASLHALQVLTRAKENAQISSYNDTESAILAAVWARAKAPENTRARENIQKALLGSLEDCWERGGMVCAGGRAARYLGSLAGVDANPAMGSATTLEAYKNQIYAETAKICESMSSEDTPAAADYAGRTLTNSVLPTEQQKGEFADKLKRAINENIQLYADKLTPAQITRITEDCMVYAMV